MSSLWRHYESYRHKDASRQAEKIQCVHFFFVSQFGRNRIDSYAASERDKQRQNQEESEESESDEAVNDNPFDSNLSEEEENDDSLGLYLTSFLVN